MVRIGEETGEKSSSHWSGEMERTFLAKIDVGELYSGTVLC